jgi:hypothetical protein
MGRCGTRQVVRCPSRIGDQGAVLIGVGVGVGVGVVAA